ncbi:cytochrome c-type biogenesis protein [Alkalispirochaeta americana]|uniref:Cytochrome c-type biogenesis protein n=1 Tax=Alkalispirochaeta americana TaxID=159291 RepID=A0A1N6WQ75_9SPIO|nr:cytochrome c biogenesis protein CcdA [Alkalispirochaeta americana]SIQ92269.1 cytochrome c-type biogenesis protein [Alkalispirochaeta americana]
MVGDLSLVAAVATALAAGFVSFLSPCVFPLVPSYMSFISGVGFSELSRGDHRNSLILGRTIAFVLGFSAVFVALGFLFSGPALLFAPALPWINLAAGSVLVFFGIALVFNLPLFLEKILPGSWRAAPAKPSSLGGAALAGAAFGVGWTPCIGPLLGSILFLAGSGGDPARAGLLLAAYSLGLGIPFIAGGMMFSRLVRTTPKLGPHLGRIRRGSGVLLVLLGALIALGQFQQINASVLSAGFRLHQWGISAPGEARRVFSLVFLAAGVIFLVPGGTSLVRRIRERTIREGRGQIGRGHRRRGMILATAAALIFFLAGMLQAAGLVQAELLLSRWLLFQGL